MPIIKVTGGTTTNYFSKMVSDETKISTFLAENNMSTSGATIQLNGAPIKDLDSTFAQKGVRDECHLFSVVNAKNA